MKQKIKLTFLYHECVAVKKTLITNIVTIADLCLGTSSLPTADFCPLNENVTQ